MKTMRADWHPVSGTWERPSEKKITQSSPDGLSRIYRDVDLQDYTLETCFTMERTAERNPNGEAKIIFSDADKGEQYRIDFMSGINICRVTFGGPQISFALEILTGTEYHVKVIVRRNHITIMVNDLKIIPILQFGKVSDGKIGLGTYDAQVTFTEPTITPFVTKKCFVIMPFDEKRNLLYESVIAPALDSHSLFAFDHSRADRLLTTGKITEEIAEHLREADVIIADISEPNPNVFYELGFAHAAETKAVLLKQQTDDKSVDVPFDLKIFRIHLYEFSTKGFADLRRKLQDILSNVLK